MKFEDEFPLKSVQPLARIESQRRQFYRPIYSLHKTFARRPGTTFRAIGLSYFLNKSIFDENNSEKSLFYQNHDFSDKIMLDPFSGGGTSIIEFHRLGVKTIGIDTNPVAWWTTFKELDTFDIKEYDREAENLTQNVGTRIKSFYNTQCPNCKSESADIMYTFWVRTINCPSCYSNQDLFKYYIIGKKRRNLPDTMIICPNCYELFYTLENLNNISECSACGFKFVPKLGNCRNKNFTCTSCNKQFRLIELLRREEHSLSARQYAIEFYCTNCNTRGYKPVTNFDIKKYIRIMRVFENKKRDLVYPDQDLPINGSIINNLRNYGFKKFSDLFNFRQLLSLSLILEAISNISNEKIREYFITVFSSCLEFHTVICPYNYTMKQIVNIFNYQSFLVPTQYVENNVWGTKKGNGSFSTYIEKIRKAKKYCTDPFEIAFIDSKITRVPIIRDKIETKIADSFSELLNSSINNSWLIADSSENLDKYDIPANSIDVIVTDPPYYDYIQYSELSNFFYVWLRILLKFKYPIFKPGLIFSDHEIGIKKDKELFVNKLTKVFLQCNRVLKDEGALIFTFHHSSPDTWAMILEVLANSSFILTKAFLIHSEFKARPVSGSNVDYILVCRKSLYKHIPKFPMNSNEIEKELKNLKAKYKSNKIISEDLSVKEIIFADLLPHIAFLVSQEKKINAREIIKNILN